LQNTKDEQTQNVQSLYECSKSERRKVMDYAYVGMIIGFAGTFAPQGWEICDGRLLPISGHETLFTIIGTTYGGDGINTFGLPNLMQRVIVGGGQGPGLTNRLLGQKGGAADVSLTVNNLPSHTHSFNVSNVVGDQTSPSNGCTLSALDQTTISFYDNFSEATLAPLNNVAVSTSDGGGASHSNEMPYQEITYIIHLDGLYPQYQ
jgi:microcystin-dependent protein